jgi:hypothetical protein
LLPGCTKDAYIILTGVGALNKVGIINEDPLTPILREKKIKIKIQESASCPLILLHVPRSLPRSHSLSVPHSLSFFFLFLLI